MMEINPTKRKRQKGQAALETVLVIIPLFAVLLGILDFSVAIFVMDTMEYAARQGVRYAVLQQVGGTGHQDDAIRSAVKANSLGFLTSSQDALIHIDYYSLDPASNTWVSAGTGSGSNAGGTLVKVSVQGLSWLWMVSGNWGCADGVKNGCTSYSGLSIKAASADIMQGCPGGVCPTR
jgi:Flp pilus assembly protein TadG